jgi:DNA-binding CsgD family transcriptional regulator
MDNPSSKSDVYLTQPLHQCENEILLLFAAGKSNRAIADQLSLALSTVKWYARQIYAKLGVNSRNLAVSQARELGLLESDIPRDNLPSQTTPFIGRDRELAEIQRLITDQKCPVSHVREKTSVDSSCSDSATIQTFILTQH